MGKAWTLGALNPGEEAFVEGVTGEEHIRQRLLDLGLVRGTKVICVQKKSERGICAYQIRGAVIALRRQSADLVGVRPCFKRRNDFLIALAGNPNVGKSTVFNGLTGMRQHTGNWPGKTVESAYGYPRTKRRCVLADLPGMYSLTSHSPEEEAAADFLRSGRADAVLVVCDACALERNLNLALQIAETGCPFMLCVNLMDEAARKGIDIDLKRLSDVLGIPVVGISAQKKTDIQKLLRALDAWMEKLAEDNVAVRAPEKDTDQKCGPEAEETGTYERLERAESVCKAVVTFRKNRFRDRDLKIDRYLTGKWTGYPAMFLLLAVVLWITIAGANVLSAYLTSFFSRAETVLWELLRFSALPRFVREALISGMFRVTGWVVAVMLPPMAVFFPLFALLEDLGYLPRIAYNLDGPFERCHACGKQALTMCMGLGCNAVGVTGCRIIDSERERHLAILTNSFMPCNGRFPMLITVSTMFLFGTADGRTAAGTALVLAGLIVLGVCVTFFWSKILSATLLKGEASAFTLELPPYRRPQTLKVLVRSALDRTASVLARAAAVAAPAGLIIWLLANIPAGEQSLFQMMADALDPFARAIGMDGVLLTAFFLGFPANEIVLPLAIMGYLAQGEIKEPGGLQEIHALLLRHGWGVKTAVCVMLFSLLHWPCSTTLLTIRKETKSFGLTAAAFLIPAVTGIFLCFCVNRLF